MICLAGSACPSIRIDEIVVCPAGTYSLEMYTVSQWHGIQCVSTLCDDATLLLMKRFHLASSLHLQYYKCMDLDIVNPIQASA